MNGDDIVEASLALDWKLSQVFFDAEVGSARTAAEKDATKNSDELILNIGRALSWQS